MKYLVLSALTALAVTTVPAAAQDRAGSVQVKVFGTAVLPDGGIEAVNRDDVGLPAGTDTEANDNYVPTIAIEYFVTDNISIETIAGTTQHDVDAVSGFPAGTELVSDALLLPATVTAKLHFDAGGVTPYIGAGPAYFIWLSDDPGAATLPLGVTETNLSDEFGVALQAGFVAPIGDSGFGLSVDAKRYFIGTTAEWLVNDTQVIETEHNLDPWVISAGVSFRF